MKTNRTWTKEVVEVINGVLAKGGPKAEGARIIKDKYADAPSLRAIINHYNKEVSKPQEHVEEHAEHAWKIAALEVAKTVPMKNGKNDWVAITKDVVRLYPAYFKSYTAAAAKEKVRKFLTAEMEKSTEVPATNGEIIKPSQRIVSLDTDAITQRVSAELELILGDNDMEKLKSPEFILEALGYDPAKFNLLKTSIREGTWGVQKKGGEQGLLSSRRVSAVIEPKTKEEATFSTLHENFMKFTAAHKPKKVKRIKVDGNNIAIISIADLHLGKLAWAPETGENYDAKIAEKRFFHIIDEAISRIEMLKSNNKKEAVEEIVFFWSQDFFHFDTTYQTTTAGTAQDSDVRWQKLFTQGCQMLTEAIEKLSKYAPVRTFYTRSNHDEQISYHATCYLSAYFRNDDNVTVDTSPSTRKYVEYGVNLFGFGHGDKEGKRMGSIMPLEAKESWGRTYSREFFLGHFHSRQTEKDANGVLLRYLASPTSTDAWHAQCGYLGAQKNAQMFIRNKVTGPAMEFTISIPYTV